MSRRGNAVLAFEFVGDVARGAGAVDDAELCPVHSAQVVVVGIAREVGDDLNPEGLPVLVEKVGIALNVVVADEVDRVLGRDGRFDGADLLVDPADVEDVVSLGLADAGKARALDGEDIDVGLASITRLATALTSSPMRAVGHVVYTIMRLMFGHLIERLVHRLLEALLAAEDDVGLLHVRRPNVLHLKVPVVAGIALGVPRVVGAPDGAMDHLDGVLEDTPDDEFGTAKRAAPFGESSRDRRGVGEREEARACPRRAP